MIRAVLEQGIKRDKWLFSLPQFDRAAPRKLFANPLEQRAPNSKFAPRHMVGATYFFWQVRWTGPYIHSFFLNPFIFPEYMSETQTGRSVTHYS